MEEVDPDQWAALFDPQEFNDANQPLKIEQYILPPEDL